MLFNGDSCRVALSRYPSKGGCACSPCYRPPDILYNRAPVKFIRTLLRSQGAVCCKYLSIDLDCMGGTSTQYVFAYARLRPLLAPSRQSDTFTSISFRSAGRGGGSFLSFTLGQWPKLGVLRVPRARAKCRLKRRSRTASAPVWSCLRSCFVWSPRMLGTCRLG